VLIFEFKAMKKSFEASLSDLEKIVRELENGDATLEESLKLFEEGVKLSRECQERLSQAERRIEVLLQNSAGEMELQTIEPEDVTETSQPRNSKRIVFDDDE
jgi:exodeoxyribonuclease VII small subunit